MLPAAPPFTAADADRWLRAALPRWVTRAALPSLWVLAVIAAVAGDTAQCTPQDPSVCGPDSAFALWFVVTLATPVLLVWMPLLGCAAGVLFALAELRYDDVQAGRWAFGLHGLLCALVAVRLVRGAAEQRRIVAAASAGVRVPGLAAIPEEARPSAVSRRVLAGLLVLAGTGFFAWYAHEVRDERTHLQRAIQAQGRIVAVDPDESVTLAVRTPSAGTREYQVGVYDYTAPYPLHSSTPVLLDPRDPGWVRLVAEPRDSTGWQSAGAGCFLLAFCWLLSQESWHRGLRALGSGEHPALRVRICPDDDGRALILPASDGDPTRAADRPIGTLAVDPVSPEPEPDQNEAAGSPWRAAEGWDDEAWEEAWDYETQEAFGRSWRDEDPPGAEQFLPPSEVEDAVLVGSLQDRGIAMLVTSDAVLLPAGRLRAASSREPRPSRPGEGADTALHRLSALWRRVAGHSGTAEPDLFTGAAVQLESLRQPPELPLTVRLRTRVRVTGALALAGGLAGYPATVWPPGLDPFAMGLVVMLFGRLVLYGAARLVTSLRLSHHQLEISGLWRTHSVPWDRLHGVRRDGEMLVVAWQPDLVVDVGPFDDPGGERGRQDRAEQLGAAMLLQRQRALLGGLPSRRTSSRPNGTWLAVALYAAVVVATLLLR